MASVSIEQLHIRLGNVDILKGIDLQVKDGEFLVLLGPSGCGKSTLLHAVAGLLDVHDGAILIDDQDVTWADPKDRAIGMVFQSYALYPTMNVERNMSFGLRINGTPKAEIDKRVQRAATMLHLGELLQRKPAQLSGGQRQRVAIGRALVRDAGVFLFDEPLSNLDAKLRNELRRELKQLHHELGTTMVYVTHDQVEAMTLASRIAVMRSGTIQQIDTPAAVYGKPVNMYVAGFLGSPSMNFIEGTLEGANGVLHFEGRGMKVDLAAYAFTEPARAGQKVVLGVRPEHVSLSAPEAGLHAHARVTVAEPMGAQVVVWATLDGATLGIITDSDAPQAIGAEVGLTLDTRHLSIFDAATQNRL